jgi:membrane-bound serine protease (ClpP class)
MQINMKRLFLAMLVGGLLLWALPGSVTLLAILPGGAAVTVAQAQGPAPQVLVLTVTGDVAPAMREYIARGIRTAEQRGSDLLVIELDTPGGMITTMQEIVSDIRASTVPVVVYVSPRGAMAASAGTLITLAGHASAMAPETIIGAASPIGSQGENLPTTAQAKEEEALKAMVRTLADRRGTNALTLGQSMIDQARAVSASEALDAGLIDFVATDLNDLLTQLDGFTVQMTDGEHVLHTAGAVTEELPPSFIERVLGILVNPNTVFLLINVGVWALLAEISNPGAWVPGFTGAVCLLLAAYGLGYLPVNWFGILFIVVAFVLFIVDVKAPTHGTLTAAGVGSLIVGALVLFNSPGTPPLERVSIPLVIGMAILTGLFFAVIISFALRAQRAPIRVGMESLVHKTGIARSAINPTGQVQAGGELWTADLDEGAEPVLAGDRVEVVSVRGMRVKVRGLTHRPGDEGPSV